MRFKLLACGVFTREIRRCIAGTPHIVDAEFSAIGSHDRPDELRKFLRSSIDKTEASGAGYDFILLCYGLCGNATVGLAARSVPLVVPRAHDCCKRRPWSGLSDVCCPARARLLHHTVGLQVAV